VLGRYRLEVQVGEGGFGRVFLARQVAFDRQVAVKAASPERGDAIARERFKREAVLVASMNHPAIVTYHDFGVDDDGDLILVMEYLRGGTLSEVVRRKKALPLATVARLLAQAAAGLAEAHRHGIVHRDVKPSNLFVVDPGTPRSA